MKRLRHRLAGLARLALGLALVVAVMVYYDAGAAVEEIGSTWWWLALPAILGLVVVHVFGAESWRLLTRAVAGVPLGRRRAIHAYYASVALGFLTPGAIGADAYRARTVAAPGGGMPRAVAATVLHRGASYVSLAILGSVAAFLVPVSAAARLGIVAIPVLASAAGLVAWLVERRLARGLAGTRQSWANTMFPAAAFTGIFHALAIGLSCLLVLAVAHGVDVVPVLASLTVARVAASLPLTPAGLGLQEGALALLLPAAGVSPEAAVAVAALSRVATVVLIGVGALAMFATTPRRRVETAPALVRAPTPERRGDIEA